MATREEGFKGERERERNCGEGNLTVGSLIGAKEGLWDFGEKIFWSLVLGIVRSLCLSLSLTLSAVCVMCV